MLLCTCVKSVRQHNEKFVFLHIKAHNKDICDHLWCSTALVWQTVQSWELELIADVTENGWKHRRSMCSQLLINVCFKRHKTCWMFSIFHSLTKEKKKNNTNTKRIPNPEWKGAERRIILDFLRYRGQINYL